MNHLDVSIGSTYKITYKNIHNDRQVNRARHASAKGVTMSETKQAGHGAVAGPVEPTVGLQPADSVMLQLSSCKECPFMKAERHYTADSFELCFDWKCQKNHGAIIACMDWNDKPPKIPQWCPLRPNCCMREKL